jgi:branched-chain amino acid aminotransferase
LILYRVVRIAYYEMKKQEMTIPLSKTPEREISVFETMRSYGGKIVGLEGHLERLEESARTLGLPAPFDRGDLKKEVLSELDKHGGKDVLIRPTLFRSGIRFIVTPFKRPDEVMYERGVEINTSEVRLPRVNAAPIGAKSNWYGPQALSYLTHLKDSFEVLYLDTEGFVGELRINNIFIIKNGRLKTPPPLNILNGLTRRLMLDLARSIPLDTKETLLTRHDLYNADECFLTNSVLEVLPIIKMDGRVIASGKPGEFTKKMRQLYHETIKKA